MALAYAFDKAKVPRGLSFPLKRGVLDAALLEAGVSGIHCADYRIRRGGHIVMRADFCGEGRRGWAAAGQASITVSAVPSSDRQVVEATLISEALPRMIGWLKELGSSGNTRRGADHHFAVGWEAGTVGVEMSWAIRLERITLSLRSRDGPPGSVRQQPRHPVPRTQAHGRDVDPTVHHRHLRRRRCCRRVGGLLLLLRPRSNGPARSSVPVRHARDQR